MVDGARAIVFSRGAQAALLAIDPGLFQANGSGGHHIVMDGLGDMQDVVLGDPIDVERLYHIIKIARIRLVRADEACGKYAIKRVCQATI